MAVQPILRNELAPDSAPAEGDPLTYSELFWFHLPLASTSLLILLAQPLVTFSLARLDQPTQSLAAWPVLFQIILMARAAALALPEAVIALSKGPRTFQPIRHFSFGLAVTLSALMALFIFSPASNFYIFVVQDMTAAVGNLALSSLTLFLFYPALATITSWLRGLLINGRATKEVNVGMAVNLVTTAVVLAIGLVNELPGLPTAAVALNTASVLEIVYLTWRAQHILPFNVPLFNLWKLPPMVQSLETGD
jgi:hypothetical protein